MGHYLSESGRVPPKEREYKSTYDAFQRYTCCILGGDAGAERAMRKFFEEFEEMKETIKRLESDVRTLEWQRDSVDEN